MNERVFERGTVYYPPGGTDDEPLRPLVIFFVTDAGIELRTPDKNRLIYKADWTTHVLDILYR